MAIKNVPEAAVKAFIRALYVLELMILRIAAPLNRNQKLFREPVQDTFFLRLRWFLFSSN